MIDHGGQILLGQGCYLLNNDELCLGYFTNKIWRIATYPRIGIWFRISFGWWWYVCVCLWGPPGNGILGEFCFLEWGVVDDLGGSNLCTKLGFYLIILTPWSLIHKFQLLYTKKKQKKWSRSNGPVLDGCKSRDPATMLWGWGAVLRSTWIGDQVGPTSCWAHKICAHCVQWIILPYIYTYKVIFYKEQFLFQNKEPFLRGPQVFILITEEGLGRATCRLEVDEKLS